jgi:hypothetical protein
MPISADKKIQLEDAISRCQFFEANHYINRLYIELVNSNRGMDVINPVADALTRLVTNLTKLKSQEFSASNSLLQLLNEIKKDYNVLVAETNTGGFFYGCKQIVLSLGGFVLGVISAVLGGVFGFIAGGINDLINLKIPTGAITGTVTGSLVGGMIGYRAPFKLQESETRAVNYLVNRICDSLESVESSINKNIYNDVIKQIKKDYFTDPKTNILNEEAFNEFIKSDKEHYDIKGTKAAFLDEKFKGSTGHHSFIKFHINHGKAICIELGASSENETIFSQEDKRTTTGQKLVDMIVMHHILQQKHALSINNPRLILWRYKAGENDCNTYVDKVLEAVGEPAGKVDRFTESDSFIGRFIGKTLRFFNPAPKLIPSSNTKQPDFLNDPTSTLSNQPN